MLRFFDGTKNILLFGTHRQIKARKIRHPENEYLNYCVWFNFFSLKFEYGSRMREFFKFIANSKRPAECPMALTLIVFNNILTNLPSMHLLKILEHVRILGLRKKYICLKRILIVFKNGAGGKFAV